ncbi:MAG TPA: endonuclease NucS [Candidatus Sulfotelmatobacter sp.]|nr:endonuclease NucS [Candidatus Sulfotelmatobacter sp.]
MEESTKAKVYVNPTLDEAEALIQRAFRQRTSLIMAGNCQVHYVGRAYSKLEPGERILMIKKDGALLIHRPTGYEPINWQPPGCIFCVHINEEKLEIHGVRRRPREDVKVRFDSIFMVSALNLTDAGEFNLHASEEDMHKAILLKPELLEDGFKPISYEKHVEPGFVDVYGVDKNGKLVVVEVKRRTAGKDAVLQLAKYIDAIKIKANRELRGILVAPHLGKQVQHLLMTMGLEFRALDPKKCAQVLRKAETTKLETFWKEADRLS